MKLKWLLYAGFFAVLLLIFYLFLFRYIDTSKSNLAVINDNVQNFSFTAQNGKTISDRDIDGKVYVAEYFFTTCRGICPRMNANMRRVYDAFKNEPGFAILSHTCMPEVDSFPLMKQYEQKMLNGKVDTSADGSYRIDEQPSTTTPEKSTNWYFLTGNKADLYKMARHSYMIDDNRRDTTLKIGDQFIHTQFFSLVDKQRRVRGIYDGTKAKEVDQLIADIKDLLKEKNNHSNFLNNMGNTPN
ncbi:MAG: SCO family protein [Ferruginibacter sp.]